MWLNETQHYLLTADPAVGERVRRWVRELLRAQERGPVLVLGTLWPAYWKTLTAVPHAGQPDPYAQARELIKSAGIRLPESFAGIDLDTAGRQAANTGDPRLAEALRQAPQGRLTQYLAGGPALLELYDNAEPAARAVLDAATDARRLGHGPALPRLLLAEAAPGYLSDEQWNLLADDCGPSPTSPITTPAGEPARRWPGSNLVLAPVTPPPHNVEAGRPIASPTTSNNTAPAPAAPSVPPPPSGTPSPATPPR
ncbi:UNVERIFIED_ORG: hypothetical protein FHR35_001498 [Microbispora rosea subsp. rosea]